MPLNEEEKEDIKSMMKDSQIMIFSKSQVSHLMRILMDHIEYQDDDLREMSGKVNTRVDKLAEEIEGYQATVGVLRDSLDTMILENSQLKMKIVELERPPEDDKDALDGTTGSNSATDSEPTDES